MRTLCPRCNKLTGDGVDGIHTCTPPAIVADLEAQLAEAQAAAADVDERLEGQAHWWQAKVDEQAKRAEQAEAQVAALATIGWIQDREAEWDEAIANLPAAAQRLLAAQTFATAFNPGTWAESVDQHRLWQAYRATISE